VAFKAREPHYKNGRKLKAAKFSEPQHAHTTHLNGTSQSKIKCKNGNKTIPTHIRSSFFSSFPSVSLYDKTFPLHPNIVINPPFILLSTMAPPSYSLPPFLPYPSSLPTLLSLPPSLPPTRCSCSRRRRHPGSRFIFSLPSRPSRSSSVLHHTSP